MIVAALAIIGAGCGRVGFDPWAVADAGDDAGPCVGDFVVDIPTDDPGLAASCQGSGCSLRAALAQANTRASSTICLADGLSIAVDTVLTVSRDVTIAGPNASICGTGATRVFSVAAGGALRLRDLTVCHGRLTDQAGAAVLVGDGGTLDADRVVFDDHVVVSDNVRLEGGAVFASGDAVIELRRSRFTNNHVTITTGANAFGRGGGFGIRATSAARVVIEDTAFEDNEAYHVGGAMFLVMDGAGLTIERSLFARNRSRDGAVIDINCAATGVFAISNSTFADNVAANQAVIFVCGTQTVRLSSCSFGGNLAAPVRVDTATSRVEWRASAVDAGTFPLCTGLGTGSSLDHNVVDRVDAPCVLGGANDRVMDPMLAVLANNGGPTATLALLPGSPAVDAAGPTCPSVDQRGLPRPARAACDAGAYEAQ